MHTRYLWKTRKLLLIGARGSARINFMIPDTIKIIDSYIEKTNDKNFRVINEGVQTKRVEVTEPLRNEITHFVDCALNNKSIRFPPEIGARAVEMIEMAFESIKKRKTVNVNEFFETHPKYRIE